MLDRPLEDLAAWLAYFDQIDIPVLAKSLETLAALRAREDEINAHDLADAVMHDPFLTLRVLRFLERHRARRQLQEITTIAHALMMVGTTTFFREFQSLPVVEEVLAGRTAGLVGLKRTMSRARHAALYAQDWAVLRHDIESDEVMVAALLRDVAEMLVWTCAPRVMMTVRALMQANPGMRSAEAQRRVFGFRGQALQLALARAWHLPTLLTELWDENQAERPRVRLVTLATRLARHSANGWFDPALPDDYAHIARFLGLSEEAVHQRILRVTLQAAKSWRWYGVPPAAAFLPMLPPA